MIFLYLILAHLISDFILQPNRLIVLKEKSWIGIFVHAAIHFLVMLILVSPYLTIPFVFLVIFGIAFSHFFIDTLKIYLTRKYHLYVQLFFLDQLAHLLILLIGGFSVLTLYSNSLEPYGNSFVFIYGIFAILFSLVFDISKFQFTLQKNPSAHFQINWKDMLMRMVVFSIVYWIFVWFLF